MGRLEPQNSTLEDVGHPKEVTTARDLSEPDVVSSSERHGFHLQSLEQAQAKPFHSQLHEIPTEGLADHGQHESPTLNMGHMSRQLPPARFGVMPPAYPYAMGHDPKDMHRARLRHATGSYPGGQYASPTEPDLRPFMHQGYQPPPAQYYMPYQYQHLQPHASQYFSALPLRHAAAYSESSSALDYTSSKRVYRHHHQHHQHHHHHQQQQQQKQQHHQPLAPLHDFSRARGAINETTSSASDKSITPNVPRGPPRKPRQSGHALWVGNLPPGATVIDLKDHFSRQATNDIESVKLISKSNCAFVNYRTQSACAAALGRFNDSRFHGTRLVCRLRRSSTVNSPSSPTDHDRHSEMFPAGSVSSEDDTKVREDNEGVEQSTVKIPERFVVLKSLTLQDLETSTRTGTWATQAHNEVTLNRAFKTCDCLYLIFSANKSGEYFGYARMLTEIASAGVIEAKTQQSASSTSSSTGSAAPNSAAPRAIRTAATEWAPQGTVIDDSGRGTIFWEADVEDSPPVLCDDQGSIVPDGVVGDENLAGGSSEALSANPQSSVQDGQHLSHTAGHSFRIQWLSNRRVPFSKTRDLRNPWNGNREVKIARDGTEIEPNIGRKLLRLFGE